MSTGGGALEPKTDRERSTEYHEGNRVELLDWVGGYHPLVLEVGCGRGGNAEWYRAHGAERIIGVELDGPSADVARTRFHEVLSSPIEAALPDLQPGFDLIVCADVLEHLVDPWLVLRGLSTLAAPGAVLAVSVPNIRHYSALLRIAFGKGFAYEPEGLFDRTHLRFFTRENIQRTLRESGWIVERTATAPGGRLRSLRRMLTRAHLDLLHEWLAYQWFVVARPALRLTGSAGQAQEECVIAASLRRRAVPGSPAAGSLESAGPA